MDYKNEQNRFVNTYFISALFCFVIVVFALLIYFILPSSTKEEISTSSEVISLEDDKDQSWPNGEISIVDYRKKFLENS